MSWAALCKYFVENFFMEKHSSLLLQILGSLWPMQRLTHYAFRYGDNYSTVFDIHRSLFNLHGYTLPPLAFCSIIANVSLRPRDAALQLLVQPDEPLIARNSELLPASIDMDLVVSVDSPINAPHTFVESKTNVISIIEHQTYPGHVDIFTIAAADGENNYLPCSARLVGRAPAAAVIIVNARPEPVPVVQAPDDDEEEDEEDSDEDEDEHQVSSIDVGTKVMKFFDNPGDFVTGEIVSTCTEKQTGATIYRIIYCNGDKDDLYTDEVEAAILLYQQRRGGKEEELGEDEEDEDGNIGGVDYQVEEEQCKKLNSDDDKDCDISGGVDHHQEEEDYTIINSDDDVEDDKKKKPATKERSRAAPSAVKRKRPSEEVGPRCLNSSPGGPVNRKAAVGGVDDELQREEQMEVVEYQSRGVIYFQYQQNSECGMHALNAILQGPEADKKLMNKWAKSLYQDLKRKMYGERRIRNEFYDSAGNYSYEVIEKVAMEEFGVNLERVTADDKDDLVSGKGACAFIIYQKDHYSGPHFYSIVLIEGSYWMIDSLDHWPRKINLGEVEMYIESHLSKEENIFMTKAEFSVIPEDCPDIYNSSLGPYFLDDDDGIGQWWIPEFLEELAGDDSSIEINMSPRDRDSENIDFSPKIISIESKSTLYECVEEFYTQNEQTLNEINWRLDQMKLHIGDKVLDYNRWTHIPVKVIGSEKVELEIVARLRLKRRKLRES